MTRLILLVLLFSMVACSTRHTHGGASDMIIGDWVVELAPTEQAMRDQMAEDIAAAGEVAAIADEMQDSVVSILMDRIKPMTLSIQRDKMIIHAPPAGDDPNPVVTIIRYEVLETTPEFARLGTARINNYKTPGDHERDHKAPRQTTLTIENGLLKFPTGEGNLRATVYFRRQ